MPWKFGLQKVDSSYHSALLRKQLIDVIVNCVNLIAAGMLMYVIVYTMQGGIRLNENTKNYPGELKRVHFVSNPDYNKYLEKFYAEYISWNSGSYLYTPENLPSKCRNDVCAPFYSVHGQIGNVSVLYSPVTKFGIFKCEHGAAWNKKDVAYGYWKCGVCTSAERGCSKEWSTLSDEVYFAHCALSNPHLQFLNEVYYRLEELNLYESPESFVSGAKYPESPNPAVESLSSEDKYKACDAALGLFDEATNETFKRKDDDIDLCRLAANISNELLEWIVGVCNRFPFTSPQYNTLLYSLTALTESECYEINRQKSSLESCCMQRSLYETECSSSAYCDFLTFDVTLQLDNFVTSMHILSNTSVLNATSISKLTIVTLKQNVRNPIMNLSVADRISDCYLFSLHNSIDKVFLTARAKKGVCMFNISSIETASYAILSGSNSDAKMSALPHTDRRHGTIEQFRSDLEVRIRNEVLSTKRMEESELNTVKKSVKKYFHHEFYPSMRTLGIGAYVIALACFLATLATYGLFPKLRTERNSTKIKILLALCTCATLYIMTMCITIPFVSTSMGCQFALVMRVYLTLVTLTWSSIEAFYLYSAIVIIETYQSRFMRKALIVGLGVPAAIVFIPVASSPELFSGHVMGCDWICTFPTFTRTYLFLLPISIAFGLNLIIYGIAANFYLNNCNQFDTKYEQRRCAWEEIRACFGLFALLVISWLTSAFSVVNFSSKGPALVSPFEVFCQLLYILSIACQGIYVFVVHCVNPPDARKQWIQIWKSFYVLRNSDKIFKSKNLLKTSKPSPGPGPVHHQKQKGKAVKPAASVRDRSTSKQAKGGKSGGKPQSVPKILINNDYTPSKMQAASEV